MELPDSLEYRRDGEIAIVHLARTAKRNALDDATIRGIERLFGNLPADVRAAVIPGEASDQALVGEGRISTYSIRRR